MFGFGIWEIAIFIGLLVVLFGARRAGRIVRRGVDLHGRAQDLRQQSRRLFSLESLLGNRGNRDR